MPGLQQLLVFALMIVAPYVRGAGLPRRGEGCGPVRNAPQLASLVEVAAAARGRERAHETAAEVRFGIACLAEGAVGSELSDADFSRRERLTGGLAPRPIPCPRSSATCQLRCTLPVDGSVRP
ncbi:hypothetical protein [Streptomyces pseudovenezuelae]|uniref:hypothetical protein n=1 Tax=Streptomyces pseudovenezuelae TaxID=67350 RepID=UPI002E7FD216|nr:hypothetical protein [Streptomyces pseudovenezuelae]WUA86497.1 hypothetical protein OHO81_04040 [Streptomyces pseudovenezuelae]